MCKESKRDLYVRQPSYKTKLGISSTDGEPRSVIVNQELCGKPEYQHVLFGRLTDQEEQRLHFLCLRYFALLWITIAAYVQGYVNGWVLYPMVALCCIRHTVNAHDCNHLKKPLPFVYRLPGYGLFCAGFLPLAPVWGDTAHQHINVHHPSTKGVLDHDESDPHSRLARMSLLRMTLTCAIMPGHVCLEDIVFHQLLKNPATLWPERVATNMFHWAQLVALYKLVGADVFWNVLTAGHVGMFVLWLFFNGLIHHVEFQRLLIWSDPSGMRVVHPVIEAIFKLVSPNAWLEIKWHDVHHAMHIANQTFGTQMARGITFEEIDLACANIADEGLYLDEATKQPVSPLAEVGHKIGSRKAFLQTQSGEKKES